MDKDILLKNLLEIAPRHRARKVKDNKEIVDYLDNIYPGVGLNQQIYSLVNNISPYCKVCGGVVKTLAKETCSISCRETLKEEFFIDIVNKRKQTCLNKYGVENPAQLKEIQHKRISTINNRYGMNVSPLSLEKIKERTENLNKKGRKTLLEKYGVENPGQLEDHWKKSQKTIVDRYGVDHYTKTAEYKEKAESRRKEKWDLFSPSTIAIDEISIDENKVNIFENPNRNIKFSCVVCGLNGLLPSETFKWRITNAGTPCQDCSGIKKGSTKEKELADFILENSPDAITNHRILEGAEIDIYVPSMKIGFEFNGLFWHNDTKKDKKYHYRKTLIAEKMGIRLIHIFEDEWDHKKEIVKSRILGLLNKTSIKIHARKCSIREISFAEEKPFLESTHIQGYSKSSIKLGLFYLEELVSVMTFSKTNLSRGHKNKDTWELLRFSSKLNCIVSGAAGKLFSYFRNKYLPKEIITYSDRRWNTGGVYDILGFKFNGYTDIGYWYIDLKNIKRIHRFSMRKNAKDDLSLTEYENRLKQGFLRIWDCGNGRWIWKS